MLPDLRHALRTLRRSPGFSAIAILTLALGIGATTAIASLLYGILLRPLPYEHPERLVQVTWYFEQGGPTDAVTTTEYLYWKEHARGFAAAAAYAEVGAGFNLETESGAQYVHGQLVGDGLFAVVGVRAFLGREFTADETRLGGPPAAVLSYGLWRDRFGALPAVVGRPIRVNGTSYTVVGVMPRGFRFGPVSPGLWLPLALRPDVRDQGHNTNMIARLSPGVTLAAAQADMGRLLAEFRRDVPGHAGERERGAKLVPYREVLVADVRPTLTLLFGAVVLVVLIAVANATGLFFGRAAARSQDIAVRAALGAGRWALARPLLAESVVLALAGGAGGILLARWTLDLVLAASPRDLPLVDSVRLDLPVLAAAFALSLAAGVVVGIVPALRVARRHGYNQRYAVVVGGGELAAAVIQRLHARQDIGIRLLGLVGDTKGGGGGESASARGRCSSARRSRCRWSSSRARCSYCSAFPLSGACIPASSPRRSMWSRCRSHRRSTALRHPRGASRPRYASGSQDSQASPRWLPRRARRSSAD